MLRYLSAGDLDAALPMAETIEAMRDVFWAASAGDTVAPERSVLRQPIEGGREALLLAMPASWVGRGFGAKVSSFIADNPAHGRAAVQGVAVLLDAETGAPTLLADAAALTARRTAAMVGLATQELAAPDACRLGIIGTGALAADMVSAVAVARPLTSVVAYNRTAAKAVALAQSLSFPCDVVASAEQAAEESDILVIATSSTSPVVADAAIAAGTHINAVGNFSPSGSELETATVGRSSVWVDTYEGALAEAGEVLIAAQHGVIASGREGLAGDLGSLVSSGARPHDSGRLTLFKSVGTALADIAALWLAQRTAQAGDLGIGLS